MSLFLRSWNAQLIQGHVVFKKYWAYRISKSLDDIIHYGIPKHWMCHYVIFCSMLFNHVTPFKVLHSFYIHCSVHHCNYFINNQHDVSCGLSFIFMGSRHSFSTCFELSGSSSSGDHFPVQSASGIVYNLCCSPSRKLETCRE